MKLAGTQSKEESTHQHLAEPGRVIEWLKKRLAGMQAGLDSSKNKGEGFRRLNSAKSGNVSSVISPKPLT